jgi:hypothetical protein
MSGAMSGSLLFKADIKRRVRLRPPVWNHKQATEYDAGPPMRFLLDVPIQQYRLCRLARRSCAMTAARTRRRWSYKQT